VAIAKGDDRLPKKSHHLQKSPAACADNSTHITGLDGFSPLQLQKYVDSGSIKKQFS